MSASGVGLMDKTADETWGCYVYMQLVSCIDSSRMENLGVITPEATLNQCIGCVVGKL